MDMPILAGKIGSTVEMGELLYFDDLAGSLSEIVCHPVRIAVICEGPQAAIFTAGPGWHDISYLDTSTECVFASPTVAPIT